MRKGNNKPSREQRIQQNQKNTKSPTLASPDSLEMQHIIAQAIVEADMIKEQRQNEAHETELREWREAIGFKDYSTKKWPARPILTFFNSICCIFRMCVVPKDKIKGDKMAFSFIPLFLSLLFIILQVLAAIGSVCCLAYIPLQYIIPQLTKFPWYENVFLGVIGLFSFFFSSIFRIASVEMEKSKDRNYLFNLFASFGTIVSIVIAIIAIVTSN